MARRGHQDVILGQDLPSWQNYLRLCEKYDEPVKGTPGDSHGRALLERERQEIIGVQHAYAEFFLSFPGIVEVQRMPGLPGKLVLLVAKDDEHTKRLLERLVKNSICGTPAVVGFHDMTKAEWAEAGAVKTDLADELAKVFDDKEALALEMSGRGSAMSGTSVVHTLRREIREVLAKHNIILK